MPFYEYECPHCRYYVEVMQKISEAPLKKCPSCGKGGIRKLISAPVFRLKGSGWYETDFKSDKEDRRNLAGADKDEPARPDAKADAKADARPEAAAEAKSTTETKPDAKADAKSDGKSDGKSDANAAGSAKPDTASRSAAGAGRRGKTSAAATGRRAPLRRAAKGARRGKRG